MWLHIIASFTNTQWTNREVHEFLIPYLRRGLVSALIPGHRIADLRGGDPWPRGHTLDSWEQFCVELDYIF